MGYSASDIISTVFRVVRNADMQEFTKLEFLKASRSFRRQACVRPIRTGLQLQAGCMCVRTGLLHMQADPSHGSLRTRPRRQAAGRACRAAAPCVSRLMRCRSLCSAAQEVGLCHMRVAEGVGSRLQMGGLLASLCATQFRARGLIKA
jgi:hypothetical protein